MRPVMAKWMLLWLEANHVAGLPTNHVEAYIMASGAGLVGTHWEAWVEEAAAAQEAAGAAGGVAVGTEVGSGMDPAAARALRRLYVYCEKKCDPKAFKLLNLTAEWLRTFLPHCLQKVDRVSFGMLSMTEYLRLIASEPHMPRSRFKLAIPFVGKDVPSRASEFAHPDIIIALTVLAYRYEGLRRPDFEQDVVALLRADFEKEVGPFPQRKSAQLYASWVAQAGGEIKGAGRSRGSTPGGASPRNSGAAAASPLTPQRSSSSASRRGGGGEGEVEDDSKLVVPLWLLKQSNDEQMGKLYELLRKLPATIHWYLEQVVFPSFMQHQAIKMSSSGQELGGSTLFARRAGFSGTPSDLLPLDLGTCGYERGTDGKMLHVLSQPDVVSVAFAEAGWDVLSLLRFVATATPRFNALIDTGALITGLSNKQAAAYLLAHGLGRWCEGVVFLDESDEKMILIKATGRVLKLSQCGISVDKRFAFYDQIHTTGMDIKHSLAARAALTLGKDMSFRDLAQGAFRMRGIGAGQTVTLIVIPEVDRLMVRELAKARNGARVASSPSGLRAEAAEFVPGAPRAAIRQQSGGGSAAGRSQQQLLHDVSAWLVVNSMRTEKLQFDQLCSQNLANLWREAAFGQLMEGHTHFKVRADAASGFVLGMLGEAFVSIREGHASRSKVDGRVVALLFDSNEENDVGVDWRVMDALLEIYKNYHGGDGAGLQVIYVSSQKEQEEFASQMREMPWLAVPFHHAQRRTRIRELFDHDASQGRCGGSTQARRSPIAYLSQGCISASAVLRLAGGAARPRGAHHLARGRAAGGAGAPVRAGAAPEGTQGEGHEEGAGGPRCRAVQARRRARLPAPAALPSARGGAARGEARRAGARRAGAVLRRAEARRREPGGARRGARRGRGGGGGGGGAA